MGPIVFIDRMIYVKFEISINIISFWRQYSVQDSILDTMID